MFRISIADKFCDWGFILLALVILLSTSFRGSLLIVSFIDEFCLGTCTSRATTRWSVPRREPVVCILWKRWKRDHHLPFLLLLLYPHSHHHHELQSRCKRSSSPRTQSPSPLSSAPSSRKSSATISFQLDIEHFFCTFLPIFDVQLLDLFHKYVDIGSIGHTCSV